MYIIKAISYKGPCERNEDAICFHNVEGKHKAVVCDGVGAYANAREAAQYVANYICNENGVLQDLISDCHDKLINNNTKYGFTTVAAVELIDENIFRCCNVGDSRIYKVGFRTVPLQISEDHTNQKKLESLYSKFYSWEEAKKMARYFSVLEAALGYRLKIHTIECILEESELLLILSDGAWDSSLEKSIKQVAQFHTPRERAEFLIQHLKLLNDIERGLEDNASLIAIWRE